MKLITTTLADALTGLETHIGLADSSLATADPRLRQAFCTAAIKSFEYTYEIAIKLIQRVLEEAPGLSTERVDELSFRGVMRHAAERGLIASPDAWQGFRHQRNKTSHTYHQPTADEVFAALPTFVVAARQLLDTLEQLRHAS